MNTCIYCNKKLPASNTQKNSVAKTRSLEIGHIDPDMLFCTLRCAAKYGVMIAREAYPARRVVDQCSFPGCDNPAMDQGRGPSVCAAHDQGR